MKHLTMSQFASKQDLETARAAEHHNVMAQIGKPKPVSKPKKAKNPPIDKAAVVAKRDGLCDCGCWRYAHDLHHAFIGRMKGYPILDDERNLVYVNHWQHIHRTFDNREWRINFWTLQCKRYGKKAMLEWKDAVIAAGLDKSRIDWL